MSFVEGEDMWKSTLLSGVPYRHPLLDRLSWAQLQFERPWSSPERIFPRPSVGHCQARCRQRYGVQGSLEHQRRLKIHPEYQIASSRSPKMKDALAFVSVPFLSLFALYQSENSIPPSRGMLHTDY